ncbi:hypothetical protein HID58_073873, partial [Brassica napus]
DPLISFGLPCTVRLLGGLPGFLLPASLITFGAGSCVDGAMGPNLRVAGTLSLEGCCSGVFTETLVVVTSLVTSFNKVGAWGKVRYSEGHCSREGRLGEKTEKRRDSNFCLASSSTFSFQ